MNNLGSNIERRVMEERSEMGKGDEVLLPGFRFHPSDEELVGFYLKRKVQQKPLAIELIRQLDIYKFDPWDLPSLAPTTGEKEWYFYCPRDRKYKNSSRPNRVTVAGFWKATGTDRPIYSSEGTKCIGLKKSLVFYRGRAARGTKTDWMMHEFRLPSFSTSTKTPYSDKNFHPNDSWAICRIFRKTTSMAQRELNQSMARPLPATKNSDMFSAPNSAMPDAKNLNCYPILDFTSYNNSTHLNFSPAEAGDVKRASTYIDFGQQEEIDNSGNDRLVASEAVIDFPFDFSWEYPSCPGDASMNWTENRCYSSLDEILQ